jgi:predicted ATPase
METLFAWIHLADIHLRHGPMDSSEAGEIREALPRDVASLATQTMAPDAIMVTGDLAAEGQDYAGANLLLRSTAASLRLTERDIFIVPGNHDVDRGAERDRSVARLLQGLRSGQDSLDEALSYEGDRKLLAQRFTGFLNFGAHFAPVGDAPATNSPPRPHDRLHWHTTLKVRDRLVRIVGLNTALLSAHGDDHGRLRVGATQLLNAAAGNGELVIALGHHPFSGGWLADENTANVALENDVHAYLFSRAHSSTTTRGSAARISAGTVLVGDSFTFGYNLAALLAESDGSLKLRVWPRRWSRKNQGFRADVDSVPDGQLFAEHSVPGRLLDSGVTKPSTLVAPVNGSHTIAGLSPSITSTGYLSTIEIENVRSIRSLAWAIGPRPGWHVVIGDNGAGKSSFLRAVAIGLLGDSKKAIADDARAFPINPSKWIRSGEGAATIKLALSIKAPQGQWDQRSARVYLQHEDITLPDAAEIQALFATGFGPFRRFTGGDEEYAKNFFALPRAARCLSLFEERISLTESLVWLKGLQFKALEDASNAAFIGWVKTFVSQSGFLPNRVKLNRITSDAVLFSDGNDGEVPIEELSDGYRSILSLTFELIRQLSAHFGRDHVFDMDSKTVIAPGIVLIDEIDAHLHPTWQREIGVWFRKRFPQIQFIVTTHSPLVCQAAADGGSVFRLPRPGTDEQGRKLEGAELNRLLYGNVLDAYGTDAFGRVTRSEAALKRLERLAELNRREVDVGLTPEEEREQEDLRATFPTARNGGYGAERAG